MVSGFETNEQILEKIKQKAEKPIANAAYITYENNGYQIANSLFIDLTNEEECLRKMNEVTSKFEFYTFHESEKGQKLINEITSINF